MSARRRHMPAPLVEALMGRRGDSPDRFLSREACHELLQRAIRLCSGSGQVALHVRSQWTGNVRWARNEIISSGDTTVHEITVTRLIDGMKADAVTSRTDDASLLACVRRAEQSLRYKMRDFNEQPLRSTERYTTPTLWSDATFAMDAAARAAAFRRLVAPVVRAQLLAAGYLEVSAVGNGVLNSAGLFAYVPETRAEYSVTVRNAKATGSGWAGVAALDWRQIDPGALTAIALDKCQRSIDPVALEPGRYTVILEPQAVAGLMYPLVESLSRSLPEVLHQGPWYNREKVPVPGTTEVIETKILQPVLDPRLTISTDCMDPEGPYVPFALDGAPMRPVRWIEQGVLRHLGYSREYALKHLNQPDPLMNNGAFRMSDGPTTVPEMIASTERGLLVTRFVNVRDVDFTTLLQTGTTSDGLWLIEKGKVTTPVKNFRFRESPLYAFNNLEALGTPVRVLMRQPTIVPPAKIRDFSMTSLSDAV